MPNRVVHFEIPAKDVNRASDFYAKAFGWDMQKQGEDYGGYVVATSGPALPDLPKNASEVGINGGVFQADPDQNLKAFRCVIGVDDIDKAIENVRSAGGTILHIKDSSGKDLGEKTTIPGVGTWAKCLDTEGNEFSLMQPAPGDWQKANK